MVNNELLLQELRHATIHPEQHDQSTWAKYQGDRPSACGSVGCLAGNTVINEGLVLAWELSHVVYRATGREYRRDSRGWTRAAEDEKDENLVTKVWIADEVLPEKTGDLRRPIEVVAAELLGLREGEADKMFEGDNSIKDLWTYAIVFTDGAISIQDYLDAVHDAATVRAKLVAG